MPSCHRRSGSTRDPRARSRTRCRRSCAAPIRGWRDDLLGMKWVAGFADQQRAGAAGDQRGRRPQRRRRPGCRSRSSTAARSRPSGPPPSPASPSAQFAPAVRRTARRGRRSSAPASRVAAISPVLGRVLPGVAADALRPPSRTAPPRWRTRRRATDGIGAVTVAAGRARCAVRTPTSSSPPPRSGRSAR